MKRIGLALAFAVVGATNAAYGGAMVTVSNRVQTTGIIGNAGSAGTNCVHIVGAGFLDPVPPTKAVPVATAPCTIDPGLFLPNITGLGNGSAKSAPVTNSVLRNDALGLRGDYALGDARWSYQPSDTAYLAKTVAASKGKKTASAAAEATDPIYFDNSVGTDFLLSVSLTQLFSYPGEQTESFQINVAGDDGGGGFRLFVGLDHLSLLDVTLFAPDNFSSKDSLDITVSGLLAAGKESAIRDAIKGALEFDPTKPGILGLSSDVDILKDQKVTLNSAIALHQLDSGLVAVSNVPEPPVLPLMLIGSLAILSMNGNFRRSRV